MCVKSVSWLDFAEDYVVFLYFVVTRHWHVMRHVVAVYAWKK